MKTERQIIEDALKRQGILSSYQAATGELRINGAVIQFYPNGEIEDIRGYYVYGEGGAEW